MEGGVRGQRNNTLYQTQIYTTRMSALAAGTKHCTPPVGTTDHFHTKSARTNFTVRRSGGIQFAADCRFRTTPSSS